MLPFFLPAWESDVTARAALEQSVASSLTALGQAAMLSGADVTVDGGTRDPGSTYTFLVHGVYARLFNLSTETGASVPADNVAGEFTASGSWQTTPMSRFMLETRGYLARALGVRAFDDLAARDPFLRDRLEYTLADNTSWTTALTKRTSITFSAGYVQMGALAADDRAAVGVDMHQGLAGIAYAIDAGASDRVTPELRGTIAHYYNAVLDVDLHRGPADIKTGSALLTETHDFTRRLSGSVTGGATVATPPPVLRQSEPIVSPEARVALNYVSRRYGVSLAYAYTYASLGPAIGYGKMHNGTLEIAVRPADGAKWRDFMFKGITRVAIGSTPVSADPAALAQPDAPSAEAILHSRSVAAGAVLEYPLRRGISMFAGFDLAFTNAEFIPAPAVGSPGSSLISVFTLGVAGTISTDPQRTVRMDPADADDLARKQEQATRMPVYQATLPPSYDKRIQSDRVQQSDPVDRNAPKRDASTEPPR